MHRLNIKCKIITASNTCENCHLKDKKCYKCRKIGIKKMAEKVKATGNRNQRNFSVKKGGLVNNNNGSSTWSCLKCSKKFRQIAKLLMHKKSCSKSGVPLRCKMCNKVMVDKKTLDRHVQVMHLAPNSNDTSSLTPKDFTSFQSSEKRDLKACSHCKKNIPNKVANDLCKKCLKNFTPKVDVNQRSVLKPKILRSTITCS